MSIRLRAGATTDVGRVRSVNQDSFLVLDDRGLYAVADGMGGHQGGEVASTLAVEALKATFVGGTTDALAESIEEANLRIHERGEADPDLQGMGTTVVAVAVVADDDGGSLLIANVGDSRAYLFRDGDLTQLTEDHSMVADLVREGRITEAEAETHPQRNIVTRVLGVYDQVDVDLWPVDAVRGDRVLLCSDGLFNEVASDQIAAVLRRLSDPQEAADELVRRANEGGGRDNITVLVVDVVDDGGVAAAASSALAAEPSALDSDGPDLDGFTDLAGFTTASIPQTDAAGAAEPAAPGGPMGGRRRRRDEDVARSRRRLSWRSVGFLLLIVAVIGGAFATIQWYGTTSYYVGFDGDEVVIYQGRPGGVLWIDPTVEERTGVDRDEVPARTVGAIEDGSEQASLADARAYVRNMERDIAEATAATSTTTTTVPVDPNASTTVVAP